MNKSSNVLTEHDRIVTVRHLLAFVNYLAIFAATLVTQYFMSVKGAPEGAIVIVYVLLGINAVQIALSLVDFILKRLCGVYAKALAPVSYAVGGIWILLVAAEVLLCVFSQGIFRLDLVIIAAVHAVSGLIVYLLWPMLDRFALDAMMRRSVRDDDEKRAKKSKKYVVVYSLICTFIVLVQAGTLFLYKVPPTVYDLFENTRALGYELAEDGSGYVVTEVYAGTSPVVNVPAYYNDLPVVGVASGAIAEENVLERNKVRAISFGTPATDDAGNSYVESNLEYLESGAIVNNSIVTITLPASLKRIGSEVSSVADEEGASKPLAAISGDKLETIVYEARANFEMSDYACPALKTVTLSGDSVGPITDVEGIGTVRIEVSKDIYNHYRQQNIEHASNFRPLLDENEICVDFYTGCDVYIESIIATDKAEMAFNDLKGLSVDTTAFNLDHHELGTDGAKADSAFRGWYTDPEYINLREIATGEKLNFEDSISLYAKWVPEYKADLDWGYYDGVANEPRIVYWTDERAETLPAHANQRTGYAAGVRWNVVGEEGTVKDTASLHRNVSLEATWVLDAPAGIGYKAESPDNTEIAGTDGVYTVLGDNFSFIYDESRGLTFTPNQGTHALYESNEVGYAFTWTKEGSSQTYPDNTLSFKNVADSGTYTLRVTVTSNGEGRETAYSERKLTVGIARKALEISGLEYKKNPHVYNGTAQTHLLNASGEGDDVDGGNNAIFLANKLAADYTYELRTANGSYSPVDAPVNAGTYRVTAKLHKESANDRPNYTEEELSAEFVIDQKPIGGMTWKGVGDNWTVVEGNPSIVYDGSEHRIELVFGADDLVAGDAGKNITFSYSNAVSEKNVGDYVTTVTGISDPNYKIADDFKSAKTNQSWSIQKKQLTGVTWTLEGASGNSVTYDGAEHLVSAAPKGVVQGDDVAFSLGDDVTGTAAKGYTARVTGLEGEQKGNYAIDDLGSSATYQWTINKRRLSFTWTGTVDTYKYDGTACGADLTIGNIVEADAALFKTNFFDVTQNTATVTGSHVASGSDYVLSFRSVKAGKYEITALAFSEAETGVTGNYDLSAFSGANFEIKKAQLTFTETSGYVYDGTEQTLRLKVEGLAQNEVQNITHSFFDSTATGAYWDEREQAFYLTVNGTNAEDYTIAINGFAEGTSEEDGPASNNYVIQNAHAKEYTLTIAPRPLTVTGWTIRGNDGGNDDAFGTSEPKTVTYNRLGYVVRATVDGIVENEAIEFTYANAEGTNKGTYNVSVELPATYSNYEMTKTSGTWEITAKELTVSWTEDSAPGHNLTNNEKMTYKGTEFTINAALNGILGDDEVPISYEQQRTGKDVGNYRTEISIDNSNYVISGSSSLNWEIVARMLKFTFEGDTFTYNGQYLGPKFCIEGTDENAKIASADIARISVHVQPNNAGKELTFEYNANGYSLTGEHGFAIDAGEYGYQVWVLLDEEFTENYEFDDGGTNGSGFTIEKKALELENEWVYTNVRRGEDPIEYREDDTLVYNAKPFTFKLKNIGGLVTRVDADAPDQIELSYKGNVGTNVDDYVVSINGFSGRAYKNYELPGTLPTLTWSIAPKRLNVKWSLEKNDGSAPSSVFTATYNAKQMGMNATAERWQGDGTCDDNDGLCYEEGITFTLNAEGSKGTDVGTYTATIGDLKNANYTYDEGASQAWSIEQYEVTSLAWTQEAFVYNGEYQAPDASFTLGGVTVRVTQRVYSQDGNKNVVGCRNTGTYFVTATALDNGNFKLKEGGIRYQFRITPKPLEFEWRVKVGGSVYSLDEANLTYTGAAFEFYAIVNDSLCPGDGDLKLTYRVDTNGQTLEQIPLTDAAKYRLTVTDISSGNDLGNYTIETGCKTKTADVTIEKQRVTVKWTLKEGAKESVVYDGEDHYNDWTLELFGKVNGEEHKLSSDDFEMEVKTGNASTHTARNAGTYTYTPKIMAGRETNFTVENVTNSTRTLVINQRPVELEWSCAGAEFDEGTDTFSLVYDRQAHRPTPKITNLCDSDRDATITILYSGDEQTNATAGFTYRISGLNGAGAQNYTLQGVSNLECVLKIEQKELTVAWTGVHTNGKLLERKEDGHYEVVYDGSEYALTATLDGTILGDNASIVWAKTDNVKTVGSYTFEIASLSNGRNYCIKAGEQMSCTLKITPATVQVKWGETECVYDGKPHHPSYTLTDISNDKEIEGDELDWFFFQEQDITDVGTARFTLSKTTENYVFAADAQLTCNFEVKHKVLRVEWTGTGEVEETGEPQRPQYTLYDENGEEFHELNVVIYVGGSESEPGTYQYKLKIYNDNYRFEGDLTEITVEMTIKAKAEEEEEEMSRTESVSSEDKRNFAED